LLTIVNIAYGLDEAITSRPTPKRRRNNIQLEFKMQRRTLMKAAMTAMALTSLQAAAGFAENTVLKIGFVGVTSGPAAA
jgi:hypothetical protein